jgi:hypothetical protein
MKNRIDNSSPTLELLVFVYLICLCIKSRRERHALLQSSFQHLSNMSAISKVCTSYTPNTLSSLLMIPTLKIPSSCTIYDDVGIIPQKIRQREQKLQRGVWSNII